MNEEKVKQLLKELLEEIAQGENTWISAATTNSGSQAKKRLP